MNRNEFTDLQEKWLQALESGEWKQADGVLFDGEGYCCLGVACRLVDDKHPALALEGDGYSVGWSEDGASNQQTAPPDVQSGLLLKTPNGDFVGRRFWLRGHPSLTDANDNGASFPEIAAHIRKYAWAVFTNFDAPEGRQ
jgi:hypothetical protein